MRLALNALAFAVCVLILCCRPARSPAGPEEAPALAPVDVQPAPPRSVTVRVEPPFEPITREPVTREPPPAEDVSAFPDAVPAADLGAFTKLGDPGAGDWRERHPEEGAVSFEEYVNMDPVRADGDRRTLAFVPFGEFGAAERKALADASAFAGIWFDLPVQVLDGVPLTDDAEQFRMRSSGDGTRDLRQYRTGWFLLDALPDRLPEDAVVLLGVTMADLYPGPTWNYVFGEAKLIKRVGVYSLVRFFPEFWGEEPTDAAGRRALLRTLKLVVHETGHTFGLEHCVEWACAMNGSNSLGETDRGPLRLCPGCLKKLAWNRGFDVAERYRRLAEFLDAHGFADEAAWNRDRRAHVRRADASPR